MACEPIKNGNVILVEPNCVNINNDIVNGIPQYQDMYIFAELTAKSKGRTIIIDGNTNSTTSKKINFLGNNQDNESANNPNYLNFTTNYYEGSTGNATHYEGFGISNIKIVINSSFIPQVNIQFVDIRGLAFFNQQDSPYRILFDFPPPIFTLRYKEGLSLSCSASSSMVRVVPLSLVNIVSLSSVTLTSPMVINGSAELKKSIS